MLYISGCREAYGHVGVERIRCSFCNVLFEFPHVFLVHMQASRIRMNVKGYEQGSEQLFKRAGSKNNMSGREDTNDSVPNLCIS